MARKIEDPVVTKEGDREVQHHPAFGQIRVSHVHGSRALYGSDFEHGGYISIEISASELHRDLSRDWYFERKTLLQLDMSHAQYVAMVGAPNQAGQPCTLNYYNGESIPGFPVRDSKEHYPVEMAATIGKAVEALEQLKKTLQEATTGLSKTKSAQLIGPVDQALMQIRSNAPFVAASFNEHMEATVEKARVEVHAYMNNVLVRAGLEKLQGDIKLLEGKSGDQDHQKTDE